MKLLNIRRFLEKYFDPKSAPDARTVRRWIDSNAIPGVVIERNYFINQESFESLLHSNGDQQVADLVDRVLESHVTSQNKIGEVATKPLR